MGSFSNPCLKILLGWRQIPGSVQSDMKTLHVRAGPPAWAAPPSSKQPQYNVILFKLQSPACGWCSLVSDKIIKGGLLKLKQAGIKIRLTLSLKYYQEDGLSSLHR